ncbi:hypothetical protein ERO13_D11G301800v2 [Gossypium hirsutum]|uniref:LEAF RUST 10 DISEASE-RESISTANCEUS RECEPTOR-LIKE PROTEIN KINASE-like 2.3 n=1 Tax=Gossypium hirsutum TaxID=3635 RepID=A0A1U8HQC1_GOSHI|nr:LEAF RUST 10 DISEASE-RESISTANCE LOCUS RECEPTOR-LIKE PROTEIN KINASE-like 2.3 [Gossypium hirsutum]KAG4123077.1 hypothetical protein ERO13_D11G301800v2 [Gossypium hirsutum]
MPKPKPQLPIHGLVAAIVVLLQLPELCVAKTRNKYCNSTVCGNVTISYPFRLPTQPPNCGEPRFELDCDSNNRTVLSLNHGRFYVQNIWYEYSTIRAIDPNLAVDDCSLPRGSLLFWDKGPYSSVFPLSLMYVVNCTKAIKSSLYIDASRCPVNSSGSDPPPDSYVYFLGERTSPRDFDESCRIEATVPVIVQDISGFSTSDIYEKLLKPGFELSWTFGFKSQQASPIDALLGDLEYALQSYIDSFIHYLFKGPHIAAHASYYAPKSTYILCLQITGGFILARILPGIICLIGLVIYKWRRRHLCADDTIEEFLERQKDLMPIRYSYREIEKMSNGFKDKLGEGGYGSVFKGKLRSGYFVAIKLLGKAKGNGQDFINEVATIGRIHHVNVAKLTGFCVEGSKHALVYDFMPNGSLDRIIFTKENKVDLSWKKMFDIALGVARGLDYLHQGCDMQILHFDIKPHDILLYENFTPKVADFGLAKRFSVDDSIVSLTVARGTIGYIAPELVYKNLGGVSYKADVYSFGMLLMEIIGRRKNMNTSAEHESQKYFPSWIYDRYYHGEDVDLGDVTDDEKIMVKKMVIIASWCVQVKPNGRPSMSKVLEMFETDVELLQMPPKPFQLPFEVATATQSYASTKDQPHDSSTDETSDLLHSSNEISVSIL